MPTSASRHDMTRIFAIGDLQGERRSFERLLQHLRFDATRDRLILLGDLVNRGHDSLGTLRAVRALGDAATVLLGNHDLHLLAVGCGGELKRKDKLRDILDAPDREELLQWLRQQRLAYLEPTTNTLCVHAGVPPAWTVDDALQHAAEVEAVLRGKGGKALLDKLYGNEPDQWSDHLAGQDRWRYIINAFTRQRMVDAQGRLCFDHKGAPNTAPAGQQPWFAMPDRKTQGQRIVFGHWSLLNRVHWPEHQIWGLDTGCVWGGALTALELISGEMVQQPCVP